MDHRIDPRRRRPGIAALIAAVAFGPTAMRPCPRAPIGPASGELWTLVAATRGCAPPPPALCEALGLDELRDLPIERMSLGQRRRACLGAAFLGPPELLVLDEPDSGLDARRLDALVDLLRADAAAGRACLLASHDSALLDRLGARVLPLADPPPA